MNVDNDEKPTSADRALAQIVRDRRKSAGQPQSWLASGMRLAGFPTWRQSMVSKVENGERRIYAGELVALCSVLALDISFVVRRLQRIDESDYVTDADESSEPDLASRVAALEADAQDVRDRLWAKDALALGQYRDRLADLEADLPPADDDSLSARSRRSEWRRVRGQIGRLENLLLQDRHRYREPVSQAVQDILDADRGSPVRVPGVEDVLDFDAVPDQLGPEVVEVPLGVVGQVTVVGGHGPDATSDRGSTSSDSEAL